MWFVVYEGRVKIIKSTVTLGRGKTNDIVIDRKTISKSHCQFIPSADSNSITLKDLGSTLGTKVDGENVESITITKPQTTISVGGFDINLHCLNLVVCTTGLPNYSNDLVQIVDQVTPKVDFLLASGIAITAKVVLSLCYGIPIVTTEFIEDLEKLLPDCKSKAQDYRPNLSKPSKRFENVDFNPVAGRRTLFQGVTVLTVGKAEVDAVKLVVEAASGIYLNYVGKVEDFEQYFDSINSEKIVFVKQTKLAAGISKTLDSRSVGQVSAASIHSAILYNTLDDLKVYEGNNNFLMTGNAGKRKAEEAGGPSPKRLAMEDEDLDEVIPPTPVRKSSDPPVAKPMLNLLSNPTPITKPTTSHLKFGNTQLSQPAIKISTESPFSHSSLRKISPPEESLEIPVETAYQTQTAGSLFDNFMDDILGFEPMDVGQSLGNSVNQELESSMGNVESVQEPVIPGAHSVVEETRENLPKPAESIPATEPLMEFEEIPTIMETNTNSKPDTKIDDHLKSIEIKVEIVPMCAPSRPMTNYKPFRNKNFTRPKVLSVVPSADILSG